MSFPVVINFATPAEGACPATFTDAVALLQALISGEVTTSFTPYVLGSSTPAVEDQNKVWIRLDAVGRPLGTFVFYAGNWRRQYSGKAKEMTFFNGDPAIYFDGTGLGLITAEWDGWALCNGMNGTVDLSDRFLIGGHMDNVGTVGYSSGWRTLASGGVTSVAGASTHTIVAQNLPELALTIDGNEYKPGGSPHVDARVIIDLLYDNAAPHTADVAHYGFDSSIPQTQTAVPTLPPYYAMAICTFVGYS